MPFKIVDSSSDEDDEAKAAPQLSLMMKQYNTARDVEVAECN